MPRIMGGAEAQFTAVLDKIYEAPVGSSGWQPTLLAISDFLGAECTDLSFFDPGRQQMTRWEIARFPVEAMRQYSSDYLTASVTETHPRLPVFLRMTEPQILADSDVWTNYERRRMPFFTDFYRRQGLYDCLMAFARKTGDGPWLAVTPHFKRATPGSTTRGLLRTLLPHIRRACEIEEKLADSRREAASLTAALDGVAEAVSLVDAAGRVVKANRLAVRLFRAQRGLTLGHDERLIFAGGEARDAFARALAECANPLLLLSKPAARPPAQVIVHRSEGHPLMLTLQALPSELKGAYRAVAILFISDPEAKPADLRQTLRAAYSLSPAEARLVQALNGGFSLKDFAASNSLSYETVRSYLRRVFMKTGARRQSDLVRITRQLR